MSFNHDYSYLTIFEGCEIIFTHPKRHRTFEQRNKKKPQYFQIPRAFLIWIVSQLTAFYLTMILSVIVSSFVIPFTTYTPSGTLVGMVEIVLAAKLIVEISIPD